MDIYRIDICTDCAVWHANADDSGFCWCEGPACTNAEHEAIRTAPRIDGGHTVYVTGDETFFSRYPCEACGSRLGGDRIAATTFAR